MPPASAPSAAAASAAPLPFTPIIFCGPGANLYPLCDPQQALTQVHASSSSSPSAAEAAGIKALLPIANRPLLAYPLQLLCTAGIDHAIVVAARESQAAIVATLRTCSLQLPSHPQQSHHQHGNASGRVNIVVREWSALQSTSSSTGLSTANADASAFRVELFPLGPHDHGGGAAGPSASEGDGTSTAAAAAAGGAARGMKSAGGRGAENEASAFGSGPGSRMGTAQLLLWLWQLGRVQSNPLILPCDLVSPAFPLAALLTAHLQASFPHASPPAITALLYERGAGEGTGREREKEAPPRALFAYASTELIPSGGVGGAATQVQWPSGSSSTGGSAATPLPHSLHSLLLHRDEETFSSDDDDMDVRMSLLWSHPRTTLATHLLDAHAYVLSMPLLAPLLQRWSLRLTSLREHVLPTAAKCSWQNGLLEKIGWTAPGAEAAGAASAEGSVAYASANVSGRQGGTDGARQHTRPDADADADAEDQAGSSMLAAFLKSTNTRNLPVPPPYLTPQTQDGDKNQPVEGAGKVNPVRCVALIARLRPRGASHAGTADAPAGSGATNSADKQKGADAAAAARAEQHDEAAGGRFIARANTLPTYIESNRYVLKLLAAASAAGNSSASGSAGVPPLPAVSASAPVSAKAGSYEAGGNNNTSSTGAPPAAVPSSTMSLPATAAITSMTATASSTAASAQISADSLIGAQTRLGERTTVKKSVIGRSCWIGRACRLQGCVIMDGCFVGEGAKLENTLLAPGSKVGERVTLKDCDVGPGCRVPADTSSKNEKFVCESDDENGEDEEDGQGSEDDDDEGQ
ncbi:hypothetical protein K437DRAFT_274629 [Tilletiaria anomala UBC 951]|uniref:Translation initiation factor eIF2B subunit gamma n=1 Tax=Tilletiaria anomala (strain ATCC 24038 / CBS 436.72 / UBC 951) TaxID=1037660 RepID=A0A066VRZ8_TILAU|nr:uncharacterized protein K437DRAFT_274629 [Tilletiaria anomala UBC 951]KDN44256.1 hypothetical protein K437DRAFT_274629 [Tilletiaria anomala UBC 951]